MPVADVFAAGTGLLDFGRQPLYGPQRRGARERRRTSTTTAGSPDVPDYFIERPRLTRLLDEATAPVIMLIAPAGFGKTTLARQWLAPRRRGWYRGSPAAADVAALAVGLARSGGRDRPRRRPSHGRASASDGYSGTGRRAARRAAGGGPRRLARRRVARVRRLPVRVGVAVRRGVRRARARAVPV